MSSKCESLFGTFASLGFSSLSWRWRFLYRCSFTHDHIFSFRSHIFNMLSFFSKIHIVQNRSQSSYRFYSISKICLSLAEFALFCKISSVWILANTYMYLEASKPKWVNLILNIIEVYSLRLGDLHFIFKKRNFMLFEKIL